MSSSVPKQPVLLFGTATLREGTLRARDRRTRTSSPRRPLPPDVAAAAAEFITGPLLENPQRVGKALTDELAGVHSARLGRNWRVLYEINDAEHVVIVLDIRPRANAYRPR